MNYYRTFGKAIATVLSFVLCFTFIPIFDKELLLSNADDIGSWSPAYSDFILDSTYRSFEDKYFGYQDQVEFGLYDLDKNGVPELVAYNGGKSMAEMTDYVYSYQNGSIRYLGDIGMRGGSFEYYSKSTYPGLYSHIGNTGYTPCYYYCINNGILCEELVFEDFDYLPDEKNAEDAIETIPLGFWTQYRFLVTDDTGLYYDFKKCDESFPMYTVDEINSMGWASFVNQYTSSWDSTVTIAYPDGTSDTFDHNLDYYLGKATSTSYNPELAYLLMSIAYSAYSKETLLDMFNELDFDLVTASPEYDKPNSILDNLIRFGTGKKKLKDGKNLVLIDLAGTKGDFGDLTAGEWWSDFNITTNYQGFHNGFHRAAQYVMKSFPDIDTKNTIYVVTGHSRGAAVGNIIAKELSDAGVPKSNLYNYNFACPDVAKLAVPNWNNNGKYDNILNISCNQDPFSVLPGVVVDILSGFEGTWGKFGQSLWFSHDWSDITYSGLDFSSHAQNNYLDYLRKCLPENRLKDWLTMEADRQEKFFLSSAKIFALFCPVDIEVRDASGEIIAAVYGEEGYNYGSEPGDVIVLVDGDSKFIYVKDGKNLDVKLIGTDSGTMTFGVAGIDSVSSTGKQLEMFTDVSVEKGRIMKWNCESSDDVTKNRLDLLDFFGNVESSIGPDSEETKPPENPFSDVSTADYFYNPVLWALNNDVTKGTSDSTFSPYATCTRAQAVTFLWRAAGSPKAKSNRNPFTDVKTTNYYYDAVLWAVENGITTGTSATTFSPDSNCSRAQIVTFLYRASGDSYSKTPKKFTDVKSSDYFAVSVAWAVEKEITTGTSNSTFSPEDNCTRGQIVTFLYRYYN